jgi:hypothetical protein
MNLQGTYYTEVAKVIGNYAEAIKWFKEDEANRIIKLMTVE